MCLYTFCFLSHHRHSQSRRKICFDQEVKEYDVNFNNLIPIKLDFVMFENVRVISCLLLPHYVAVLRKMVLATKLTLDVFCKSLYPKRPTNTAEFEKYLDDSVGLGSFSWS